MQSKTDGNLNGSRPALILIEHRTLFRTCIVRLLENELKDLDVIEMSSVDEAAAVSGRTIRLAVLSAASRSLTDPTVLREITELNVTLPNVPLVIVAERDDEATFTAAIRCGASLLSTSVRIEDAIAGLRLLLTDSVYCLQQRGQSCGHAALSFTTELSNSRQRDIKSPTSHHRRLTSDDMWSDITPREEQVLGKLLAGMPNKMIATHLHISENTAKMHIHRIIRKLRARNRTEAALLWSRRRSDLASNSAAPERDTEMN